jgi:pimeloyl-ACP methyl ester carboxylesterase
MQLVIDKVSPSWMWPVTQFFLLVATNVFLYRIGLFWNRASGAAAHKVRKITVPIFIMHGDADEIVPLAHGQEMYNNAPESLRYFWMIAGSWHCASYDRYPDEFRKKVGEFLDLIKEEKE